MSLGTNVYSNVTGAFLERRSSPPLLLNLEY